MKENSQQDKKFTQILREILVKVILLLGITLLSVYLFFRVQLINLSLILIPFSILLFIAELHTIFHLYGMFYSLWPRRYKVFNKLYANKNLRINIFICVCGEPEEIVRNTIIAAKAAVNTYVKKISPNYRPNLVVLNDGYAAKKENWLAISELCQEFNVRHVVRKTQAGFKAGNINNGLREFPSKDPLNTIDIIFDSDFAPKEECLLEIVKPFAQKDIDFVQSPQRYQNEKTWVAKSAAAHQIFFFDYICPAKSHDNALFLCGTNFAIRRSALESVKGMDERFITEDYATSLNLHLLGRKGVFMPKVLALGMAPSTLKAYFSQQQRWSKGNFDVTSTYLKQLLFGNLTLKQKFHYMLSATYYLIGIRDLILILAPLPYLFLGIPLIKANTLAFLLLVYGPFLIYNFTMYARLFKSPLKSLVLDIISFPIFTRSFLSSVLGKNLNFVVTIKKYERENPFRVYRLQMIIALLLFSALFFNFKFHVNYGIGAFINSFWAIFNSTFLTIGFYLIVRENYNLSLIDKIFQPFLFFIGFSFRGANAFSRKLVLSPAYSIRFLVIFLVMVISVPNLNVFAYSGARNLFVQETTSRRELLVPEDGVYYGYYLPSLNKHPKNPSLSVVDGEKPSLTMFYQDWGSEKGFDSNFMEEISKQNVIPVVTWEPWNSKLGKESTEQKQYSPKAIAQGKYDDYIRTWAKGVARYKKPIFLRFAQEMNGNWYGWGNVNGNKPEDFKKMWIHVHDIFEEEKATNVLWVWAPNNTDEYGETDSIPDYYPGDKYVDWVGFSGFNWGTSNSFNYWMSFKYIANDAYEVLSKYKKPIMVAETSSVTIGGDRSAWYYETVKEDIPSFPNIKAVIFWNSDFKNSDFMISEDIYTKSVIEEDIIDNDYYLKEPRYHMVI